MTRKKVNSFSYSYELLSDYRAIKQQFVFSTTYLQYTHVMTSGVNMLHSTASNLVVWSEGRWTTWGQHIPAFEMSIYTSGTTRDKNVCKLWVECVFIKNKKRAGWIELVQFIEWSVDLAWGSIRNVGWTKTKKKKEKHPQICCHSVSKKNKANCTFYSRRKTCGGLCKDRLLS